jgi:hypothetical protein
VVEHACVAQVDDQIQIVLVLDQLGQRLANEFGVRVSMHGEHDLAERDGPTRHRDGAERPPRAASPLQRTRRSPGPARRSGLDIGARCQNGRPQPLVGSCHHGHAEPPRRGPQSSHLQLTQPVVVDVGFNRRRFALVAPSRAKGACSCLAASWYTVRRLAFREPQLASNSPGAQAPLSIRALINSSATSSSGATWQYLLPAK